MPKRNVALLYGSFGLGLRAKEMAALKVKHVLGADDELLEEINLTGSMTKGNKQRHAYLTNLRVVGAIRDFIDEREKCEGIRSTSKLRYSSRRREAHFRQIPYSSFSTVYIRILDCKAHLAIPVDARLPPPSSRKV